MNHVHQDSSFFISFVGCVNHIAYKLLSCRPPASTFLLQQTCSTFGVVGATTAKFVPHADNMKFNSQCEELMCVFLYVMFNTKYTDNNGKNL